MICKTETNKKDNTIQCMGEIRKNKESTKWQIKERGKDKKTQKKGERKEMPLILLYWLMTSEVDVGGKAITHHFFLLLHIIAEQ